MNDKTNIAIINKDEFNENIVKVISLMEASANKTKDIDIFKNLKISYELLKSIINNVNNKD